MNLACSILTSFHQSVDLSNLGTAILLYQQALSAQELTGQEKSRVLRRLTNAHLVRFYCTNDRKDLQQYIPLVRQLNEASPNHASYMCAALVAEPARTTDIYTMAGGLLLEASDSEAEGMELFHSGVGLFEGFSRSADSLDLDLAISKMQAASIQLTWGHPAHASVMNILGQAFQSRFQIRSEPADLESAILFYHDALDLSPDLHPDRRIFLEKLAWVHFRRFELKGQTADIYNTIDLHHEVEDMLLAAGDPDRTHYLSQLGV